MLESWDAQAILSYLLAFVNELIIQWKPNQVFCSKQSAHCHPAGARSKRDHDIICQQSCIECAWMTTICPKCAEGWTKLYKFTPQRNVWVEVSVSVLDNLSLLFGSRSSLGSVCVQDCLICLLNDMGLKCPWFGVLDKFYNLQYAKLMS